jgi:hypothetical protein
MKENPVLITVTNLKPIIFPGLQSSEKVAFASNELQASGLENIGLEYKDE